MVMTGSGDFAGGVGGRIVWETDTIRGGRRVRGSTFVVPLRVGAYDGGGTLTTAVITAMEAGITAFMTQVPTQGRVWSRPRPGLAAAHDVHLAPADEHLRHARPGVVVRGHGEAV